MKKNLFDFVDSIIDEVTFKIDLDDIFFEPKFRLEKGKYILKLKIPGFDINELKIDIVDSGLRVKGEHIENGQVDRINTIYRIPTNAAHDTVKAKLKNGILTITLESLKDTVREIKITSE